MTRRTGSLLLAAGMVTLLVSSSCRPSQTPKAEHGPAAQPSGARFIGSLAGFQGPESVRYDSAEDVYFVSNIVGFGSVKDGLALIHRVDAKDYHSVIFAQSGRNGVVLDAPKGMAIQGDTLWVADIDVLRGFDRRSGRPVGTIDFAAFHPTMLNDVALSPDGTLRVTDTGIIMSEKGVLRPGGDKIFSVAPGRRVSVLAQGAALSEPNGITWDPAGKRWVVVGYTPFTSAVYVFNGPQSPMPVLTRGTGKFDGVEALRDGRLLYSSWSDSSIHLLTGSRDERIIRNVPEPADIGLDVRRGVVAIPLVMMSRVEFWSIPKR